MRFPVLAIIAVLALPGLAQAATVTSDGSTVTVTSPPGEAFNADVGAVPKPGQLLVGVTAGVIQGGAGCSQNGSSSVLCDVSGVPRVVVDLGDGDDRLVIFNRVDMRVEASGGPGDDRLTGDSLASLRTPHAVTTVLDGGPGNDELSGSSGTPDTLIGGDGEDEVDYGTSRVPTTITMDGVADDGAAGEGDNVAGDFERITGSLYAANTIIGSDLNVPLDQFGTTQRIDGGPAADVIDGRGGRDSIDADDGDDTVAGGAGDDLLLGNDGNDRIDGGPGVDDFGGDEGDDTLLARDGAADERLDCEGGTDTAVVDMLLDGGPLFDTCEHIDKAWIGLPRLFMRKLIVNLHRGRLPLPIQCLASEGARCSGRITVTTAKAVRVRGHRRKVVLGRAKVSLKANGRHTARLRISRAVGRRAFQGRRRVTCLVSAKLRGAPRTSDPVLVRTR